MVAGTVVFDAVALYDLQPGKGPLLLVLNGAVALLAVGGFLALGRRFRHHPEPVAYVVTLALTIATAATGFVLPSLAMQTVGYLVLIPGLIALILPWGTGTHVRWLIGYAIVAIGYLTLGPSDVLTTTDRGDLILVAVIAIATSLAGHSLLKRAQIRNFTQLQKIHGLHRKADADMTELARIHRELEVTARTDPLTGAGNRVRMQEDLRTARARMNRLDERYGLVVIDLDRFKLVNDQVGHLGGDQVLKAVVDLVSRATRAEDAIYRFGGEEFLILLRLWTVEDLSTAMERLRLAVAEAAIPHVGNPPSLIVTISLGGVLLTATDLHETDDEWFARADAALYLAKAAGRNSSQLAV